MLKPGDSQRFELLRFPLILFVIYLHATAMEVTYGETTVRFTRSAAVVMLQAIFSGGIQRVAVPLFFLFAGYLFFIDFDGSIGTWREKIRRRVGTLLVPYLFWNALITLLFLLGPALPPTAAFFNAQGRLTHVGPLGIHDVMLGITQQPIVYPMWFVRDLMVLVLLALPLHAILVRTLWLFPSALLALWAVNGGTLTPSAVEAVTYFVLGAALALRGASLFAWERGLWLFGALWLVLFIAYLTLLFGPTRFWLYKATVAAGVLTALCLPGRALCYPRLSAALVALAPASFFVFAAHEPLMTLVRKLLYRALPPTPAVVISIYLLLPLVIAAFTAALYFLLRRVAPRFAALVSGNRVAARTQAP